MRLRAAWVGYSAILSIGVALAVGVRTEARREYDSAREHYIEASRTDANTAARHIHDALQSIYENIRTLTFIPSVRKLNRHGTNLDADGREAIQQLYNNLASSVSVSEVYFVPADLDPEKIDPVTLKLEEPILMFDQLIVGAGKFAKEIDPFAAHKEAVAKEAPEIEEVEIHEYRQLKQQLTWLKQHHPTNDLISGLNVPMISGPEVITCDNTTFITTRNDADRSGLLFSVPFYGEDNKLVGSVTAIILSRALRAMVPSENFALTNKTYDYVSKPSTHGQERISAAWVLTGKPDPKLIYSEVIPLSENDPRSQWTLWVGYPDSKFHNSAEAAAVRYFEAGGYAVIGALILAALACWALIHRNMRLVQSASQMLERRVAERTEEIRHMAAHDALTGLPNRTVLREKTEDGLMRVRRGEALAILCLDLDHFKPVNDTLGHPIGDALLKSVTQRLQACAREIDTVARLGGDEFVILQADLKGPQEAGGLAQRIIDSIAEPFEIEGHQVIIGASIGIAVAPTDGEEPETLLRNADIALYKAKLEGRGTCRFFEAGMDAKLQERRRVELRLRQALAANEFILHYQPLVDSMTEKITGFEALLRWNDPERGMVAPTDFIGIAEEIGVIVPIGEWVIMQACADAASWPKDIKVAVNLSPVQFKNQTLAHTVVRALDRSGLSPSRLELEITESVLLAANASTVGVLHQLRSLGVRIAMDDFGTGYSSLSYLRSFPFDKIKIDRSFVREIAETDDSMAIVKAVAMLGASLGMTTTAEGVETADQLQKVREQGCVEVQGYYFSRPIPQSEIPHLLRKDLAAVA